MYSNPFLQSNRLASDVEDTSDVLVGTWSVSPWSLANSIKGAAVLVLGAALVISVGSGAEASAVVHPTEACLQHHCFLSSDQCASMLSRMSLQSKRSADDSDEGADVLVLGAAVVTSAGCGAGGSVVEHPTEACLQHHCFLSSDQ